MAKIDFNKVVRSRELRGETATKIPSWQKTNAKRGRSIPAFIQLVSVDIPIVLRLGIGGVVAVFLFRIVPKKKDIDEWLRVVVGDLPPACLAANGNPAPVSALEAYVEEMSAWVDAGRNGRPVAELIPKTTKPLLPGATTTSRPSRDNEAFTIKIPVEPPLTLAPHWRNMARTS